MTLLSPPELTRKENKDLRVLAQFTSVYCKVHHQGEKRPLQNDAPGVFGHVCCQIDYVEQYLFSAPIPPSKEGDQYRFT